MPVREILQLGNPQLYRISAEIRKEELPYIKSVVADLDDTMNAFRMKYRFGRAIAAPQIGVFKRLIYMQIDAPVILINPKLENMSAELTEVWDNCMSFPDLMVKVKRHKAGQIIFWDLNWNERELSLENDLAELLQHEYDHLDGILATMCAIDNKSFMLKSEFDKK